MLRPFELRADLDIDLIELEIYNTRDAIQYNSKYIKMIQVLSVFYHR